MKAVRFFSVMLALLLLTGPALALANEKEAIVAPKLINLPPVIFSEVITAEYAGKTVYVKLRISLSDSGAASEDGVKVVESSGNDAIDQAVVSAVKGAAFSPAYKAGVAVPAAILFPLQVEIQDKPQDTAAAPK